MPFQILSTQRHALRGHACAAHSCRDQCRRRRQRPRTFEGGSADDSLSAERGGAVSSGLIGVKEIGDEASRAEIRRRGRGGCRWRR